MKLTNNYNLPSEIVNLIKTSVGEYDRGSSGYTVSELISPPRIVHLKRRYWDQVEEDVSDNLWSVFGSAVHYMIERHNTDSLTEYRFYKDILGVKVGGQIDCYKEGVISDYKVTSAWSLVFGSKIEDWTRQLNCYAELMREDGHTVDKLQIICFLRDWDKHKAKRDSSYPQTAMVIVPIELWPSEKVVDFMFNRVADLERAGAKTDDSLPECTADDKWQSENKFAVVKRGAKRATRVFDTHDEALEFMGKGKSDFYIQERVGECRRCLEYCSVAKFCNFYKELTKDE